jgi:N-acetyl-alpha-D-glucosaminyl L-malate synthase BshA
VDVTGAYPLLEYFPYSLALAVKQHEVALREDLDVLHVHYAIPHATAAYLARQILASAGPNGGVPRVITTLHGTDITLLGSDRSYSETVAFCIQQSDGVTAVSESLKADTYRELRVTRDIRVIPNFLDCTTSRWRAAAPLRGCLAPSGTKIVMHVSNFRPVKRATAVVEIFARIRRQVAARLVMVGDGPDVAGATRLAKTLGVGEDVEFLGEQDQVVPLLSAADVFLLPSAQESFGLAALEAMSCEVPVVASRVGGLPEVVDDGLTGFLHDPGDLEGMAASAMKLLTDEALHRRMAQAARATAHGRFCDSKIVPMYEAYYREVLGQ